MSDDERLFPVPPRESSLYLSGYYKRIGRRGVRMCREILHRAEEAEQMMTYKVVRLHFDENHPDNRKVMATGLTLEEAKAHCTSEWSHGEGWFDGYYEEG